MRRFARGVTRAALDLRRVGFERLADAVRWVDQRLDLFSPRGAGLYARIAPSLFRPLYEIVANDIASGTQGVVLDVGTGPGGLAAEIARRCGSCRVIGVDLAPEMLATAEERAREAGVADRTDFVVADAAALPLGDGSIDAAVSTLSLHHWRDVPAVLRELHRVVRPGGRLLIYDLRQTYSPRQFAALVAETPFAVRPVEHRSVRAGRFPIALYRRFALRRG